MTDITRPDRRADYRRYPQSYFDLLTRLSDALNGGNVEAEPPTLGPFPRSQALTAKRDLYRFKMFLINADPEDGYARALADTFNEFSICMEPVTPGDGKGPHCLVFRPNPITVAMRAKSSSERAASRATPLSARDEFDLDEGAEQ